MPKRLQNTEKWQTPFYRKLSPVMKCFYQYLIDNCDFIGLWTIDFEAASFYIGAEITQSEVMQSFAGKIEIIGEKMLLLEFCAEQYGENLNEKSSIHRSVINRLTKENLLEKLYPNCRVEVGYSYPNINNNKEYNKEEIIIKSKEKEKINKKEKESIEKNTYEGKNKNGDIPTKEEFVEYGKDKLRGAGVDDADAYDMALRLKYDVWIEGDWYTSTKSGGRGHKIKSWKSTLANTLPFLKPNPTPKQSAQRAPLSREELLKLGMREKEDNL
ncbi:MAG: hypothetical protein KDD49_03930 [Bacteroidetes bacterium]|nr:hypothetical protein [Bacteroidota bacterium]